MQWHLLSLLLAAYVLCRSVLPARLPRIARALLVAFVAGAFLRFPLCQIVWGSWSPELPAWALVAGGLASATILAFVGLSLARDVLLLPALILKRLGRGRGPVAPSFAFSRRLDLALALCSVAIGVVSVHTALQAPRLVEVDVQLPAEAAALDGLRCALVSDTHLGAATPQGRGAEIARRVMEGRADIVFVTGDVADGPMELRRKELEGLFSMHAPLGVWCVPGNHEYHLDFAKGMQAMAAMGVWLNNGHAVVHGPGGDFLVAGITDRRALTKGFEGPDMEKALGGASPELPCIFLSHRPDEAVEAERRGATLVLSGHTHGGQFFFASPLVAAINGGFSHGLYAVGRAMLYVTPGTGQWSGFPARLCMGPEVTILRLHAPGRR